jgi:hypothetical protein
VNKLRAWVTCCGSAQIDEPALESFDSAVVEEIRSRKINKLKGGIELSGSHCKLEAFFPLLSLAGVRNSAID